MALNPPPIQQSMLNSLGIANQVWIRWFNAIARAISDSRLLSSLDVSGDFTISGSEDVFLCTPSGSNMTITLPDVVLNSGRVITIKKESAGGFNVILDGAGAQTIDGASTYTLSGGSKPSVRIFSNGAEWKII